MIKFAPVKKTVVTFLLFLLALTLVFQSCRKKRPEMANILFKKTHNKIFQDVTVEGFSAVMKQTLASKTYRMPYGSFIKVWYKKHDYNPEFVLNHLFNGDLDAAVAYYRKAGDHGLNPQLFQPDKLEELIDRFHGKEGIKTVDEAYQDMAELEVTAANSIINYSNALQYGVINPGKIFERYYMATKLPDSTFMKQAFEITDIHAYLDSLQPKDPQYIALQRALKSDSAIAGKRDPEEAKRMLLVNLERLRWKNKPSTHKYVMVNIPDYNLDVIDSGHSVLNMRVCVGQGRNMDNANTLIAYDDSCKIDKPAEHETPLLSSIIHSVDVNPIWNIPNSIANKEIIVEAAKDRFYLSNKSINVFRNGKKVPNPEKIDWSKVTKANSDYEFKQNPGADNSLGKIKFLFDNESSVYLHDTPVKWAFEKKMRAVSHGCVRLGNPQALALSLFGQGPKYDLITKDMAEDNPAPTTIWLGKKKTPVFITYVTCWADSTGTLQFRNDVYGLDIVLYDHLKKNSYLL